MTRERQTRAGARGTLKPPVPEMVRHPRYGCVPIPSGTTLSPEEVRGSFYQYEMVTIFPETAIAADIARQNFTTFPRGCYVDMLKVCRDCQRAFIFFAKEQKHWFEVLGFYIDSDCVRCPSCRHSVRDLRTRLQRYSEAIGGVAEISDSALAALIDDFVVLWNAGDPQGRATPSPTTKLGAPSTVGDQQGDKAHRADHRGAGRYLFALTHFRRPWSA